MAATEIEHFGLFQYRGGNLTRPNNHGTVLDIRCNKTITNPVRVRYDGLSPLESLCRPRETYSFSGRQSVTSLSYKDDNCIISIRINEFLNILEYLK